MAEAERYFNRKAYENLNYARLDTSREQRTGFAEVVYCSGKPDAYLADIYKRLLAEQGEVFGTRATPEQYDLVRRQLPDIVYDPVARTLKQERPDKVRSGCVVVCTAGTADIPVAEEAAQTAEFFGAHVGMNIGRVLFRDLRKLLFLLPKKMEVMMSSTNTTRKTIRAILIIRAKSLAADV